MTYPSESPRRLHPLIATAAGAIIIASLVATAAITGLFPRASSTDAQSGRTQSAQVISQPTVDATAPATAQAVAPQQQAAIAGQNAGQNQSPAPSAQIQQAPALEAPPPGQAQSAGQPAQEPYVQQQPGQQPYATPQQQSQAAACAACGTVESIEAVHHPGHGTGIGAIGGALAGGLVGNQFGAGTGRAAMTVLGAVGGGFGGNAVEKHLRSQTDYQVHVRMENGRMRYFTYRQQPPFQQGEPVRIVHGSLVAR